MASDKRNRKPLTAEQREKKRLYVRAWRAAFPEKARASHVSHYARHREETCAKARAYYAAHREEYRVRMAAWRAAHREELRLTKRLYAEQHREERQAYYAAYHAAHRPEHQAHGKKRRALKANAPLNDFTAQQWREMQDHYQHRCAYCHKRAKGHLTQDHLTPLAAGGSHTVSNIVPACRSCNSRKGTGEVLQPIQPLLLV